MGSSRHSSAKAGETAVSKTENADVGLRVAALVLYAVYWGTFLALGLANKLGDYKLVGYGLLFATSLCALINPAARRGWRYVLLIYAVAVVALPALAIVVVTLLHKELVPNENGGAYAFLYVTLFLVPNTLAFGFAWIAARLLRRLM
jgi:hypothetical protein